MQMLKRVLGKYDRLSFLGIIITITTTIIINWMMKTWRCHLIKKKNTEIWWNLEVTQSSFSLIFRGLNSARFRHSLMGFLYLNTVAPLVYIFTYKISSKLCNIDMSMYHYWKRRSWKVIKLCGLSDVRRVSVCIMCELMVFGIYFCVHDLGFPPNFSELGE